MMIKTTICIGALCSDKNGNNGSCVVVSSDQTVTFGDITEFEHEIPKISRMTDKIVALQAGDALQESRIVRDVIPTMPAGTPGVKAVADMIAESYAQSRLSQIQAFLFSPRGILMQHFYQGGQQSFAPQLAFQIDQQVMEWTITLESIFSSPVWIKTVTQRRGRRSEL
jgi:hypothetical protein